MRRERERYNKKCLFCNNLYQYIDTSNRDVYYYGVFVVLCFAAMQTKPNIHKQKKIVPVDSNIKII